MHVEVIAKALSWAVAAVATTGSPASARCGTTKNSSATEGNTRLPMTATGVRSISTSWARKWTPVRRNSRARRLGEDRSAHRASWVREMKASSREAPRTSRSLNSWPERTRWRTRASAAAARKA